MVCLTGPLCLAVIVITENITHNVTEGGSAQRQLSMSIDVCCRAIWAEKKKIKNAFQIEKVLLFCCTVEIKWSHHTHVVGLKEAYALP